MERTKSKKKVQMKLILEADGHKYWKGMGVSGKELFNVTASDDHKTPSCGYYNPVKMCRMKKVINHFKN